MSMRRLVPGDILIYDVYNRYEMVIILATGCHNDLNNTVFERFGVHRWVGTLTVNELGVVRLDDCPTSWKLIARDQP